MNNKTKLGMKWRKRNTNIEDNATVDQPGHILDLVVLVELVRRYQPKERDKVVVGQVFEHPGVVDESQSPSGNGPPASSDKMSS